MTCHDGFTLNDLVSYNEKHNEANGEDNRDGSDDNLSWNCGVEGPTDDPAIERLRNRQVKNFFALRCCRRARRCCSWATRCGARSAATTTPTARTTSSAGSTGRSWSATRTCTGSSKALLSSRSGAMSSLKAADPEPQRTAAAGAASTGTASRSIARTGATSRTLWPSRGGPCDRRFLLHGMLNAYWEPLTFELPPAPAVHLGWRRAFDTFLEPPQDICDFA